MLTFFPVIHHDELFYSIYARYHERGLNKHDNIRKLEKNCKAKIHPLFPKNIKCLIDQLSYFKVPVNNYFLNYHTMYNYFSNFIYPLESEELYKYMLNGVGEIKIQVKNKLTAKISHLKLCPYCVSEDIDNLGETYWRLSHQFPTSYICLKHQILLQQVSIPIKEIGFQTPVISDISETERFLYKKTLFFARRFTQQSLYLNKNNLKLIDKGRSRNLFLLFLEKGFVTASGTIDAVKLKKKIDKFYGIEFLRLVKFNQDIYPKMMEKPLLFGEHLTSTELLVFINFFFESLSAFLLYNFKIPSGESTPFPCMNHFCEQFNEKSLNTYFLFLDHKKLEIIFRCEKCNFEYEKIFRASDWNLVETIIHKSNEWKKNVLDLIDNHGLSIEEVSNKLHIDNLEIERLLFKLTQEKESYLKQSTKNSIEQNSKINWRKRDKQVLLYLKKLVSTAIIRGKVNVYIWICHAIDELYLRNELDYLLKTKQYIKMHELFYDSLIKKELYIHT